jgi:hypothetical protein
MDRAMSASSWNDSREQKNRPLNETHQVFFFSSQMYRNHTPAKRPSTDHSSARTPFLSVSRLTHTCFPFARSCSRRVDFASVVRSQESSPMV